MRVITGKLGGRQFDSPKTGKVHPMSEKVRGAIFNALGDISGLTVLDAFAGSGALSFEAASRGAREVLAIESDKSAQKVVTSNIKKLGLGEKIKLIKASAGAWLETSDAHFDLVLLDPPYDNLQPELLSELASLASHGGVIVISLPPHANIELPSSIVHRLSSKSYGDATLTFYRRV